MFNWLKKVDKQKEIAIIAIHGFGVRKTIELEPLIEPLSKYDVIRPVLFDVNDESDCKLEDWVNRADLAVNQAISKGQRIIILGFSMGGVIATHLATKYQVEKLILLAPAFEYLTVTTATSALGKFFSTKDTSGEMPNNFTQTFTEIVDKYKGQAEKVKCPVLMIAAENDAVIPSSVSSKYYKKFTNSNKHCVILEGGEHRLLDNSGTSAITISLIKNFIENKF